jgi:acetate kinase
MRILVVNAGSATLKLTVVDEHDEVLASEHLDAWDGAGAERDIAAVLADVGSVDAIGHRFVHGGKTLVEPAVATDAVIARLTELVELAPLHQQRALGALAGAHTAAPGVANVACFDTAFHASMPDAARTYAIPASWRERWPVQRFGFHGLSHAWTARRAPVLAGREDEDLRVVSCHLGAGASLCAIAGGRSVDTTMGFTPLEGLVMATRSGSVDPGLVLWLLRTAELDAATIAEGLERGGGLAALSGTSGDMREVLAARARGSAEASLAFDVYLHRLRREVAGMCGVLGGVDVLAFTGGVGEGSPEVRAAATATLGHLGIRVDPERNETTTGDGDISGQGTSVSTVVVRSREDLEIARQVRSVIR